MNLTKKELSNIIYEARFWDINPMTRYFANELSKVIIEKENRKQK